MKIEEKEVCYKNSIAKAWVENFEYWDQNKEKLVTIKKIFCEVTYDNFKFLNLGECADGSHFTSVNQAINEYKWFIDNRIERDFDVKLMQNGVQRDKLNGFNKFKISERVDIKEQMLKSTASIYSA